MPPRITKSAKARRDLREHFIYIGRDSVAAARRFLKAAAKAMQRLARMPEMGGFWESSNPTLAGMHVWAIHKFQNYLIFYRAVSEGIKVVRAIRLAAAYEICQRLLKEVARDR